MQLLLTNPGVFFFPSTPFLYLSPQTSPALTSSDEGSPASHDRHLPHRRAATVAATVALLKISIRLLSHRLSRPSRGHGGEHSMYGKQSHALTPSQPVDHLEARGSFGNQGINFRKAGACALGAQEDKLAQFFTSKF